jgi:hypothetical protein
MRMHKLAQQAMDQIANLAIDGGRLSKGIKRKRSQ